MTNDQVPAWFWKMLAGSLTAMVGTLLLTGWQIGDYVGESRMWNQAQDERLHRHIVESKAQSESIARSLEMLSSGINTNGKYGAAFKARMDAIDRRLERLEDKE